MILQIFAHPRQLMTYIDAMGFEQAARPDAGALEQRRGTDGASAQNHLAPGADIQAALLPAHPDAAGAGALQYQGLRFGMGQHGQVRAFTRRLEVGLGRVPAHPASLIDLKVTAAFVVAGVEILHRRDPVLFRSATKVVEQGPVQALGLDPPFTAIAVVGVGTAVVILRLDEQRQYLLPAPAGIACSRPGIVVGRLPAHVDHAVD